VGTRRSACHSVLSGDRKSLTYSLRGICRPGSMVDAYIIHRRRRSASCRSIFMAMLNSYRMAVCHLRFVGRSDCASKLLLRDLKCVMINEETIEEKTTSVWSSSSKTTTDRRPSSSSRIRLSYTKDELASLVTVVVRHSQGHARSQKIENLIDGKTIDCHQSCQTCGLERKTEE
jgi:hypothetical protein